MFECVIFDLDELMVDSEPLQFRAYQQAFASFDFEPTIEHWLHWHSVEASNRRWIESGGLTLDPEAVRTRKKVIYDEMIANELRLKPGVSELVDELASDYRLGVASGSRRESIEGCLARFSLLDHFEQLCSATEVERSKPYPDVYLRALQQLAVAPQVTVALEDEFLSRHALNPGILELLTQAGNSNLAVWCLSNDLGRWSQKLRCRLGVEPYLAGSVISGEVGTRKPAPEIYEFLLAASGYAATDLLFVDDREKNLRAARKLGIESIGYNPGDEFEAVINRVIRQER